MDAFHNTLDCSVGDASLNALDKTNTLAIAIDNILLSLQFVGFYGTMEAL